VKNSSNGHGSIYSRRSPVYLVLVVVVLVGCAPPGTPAVMEPHTTAPPSDAAYLAELQRRGFVVTDEQQVITAGTMLCQLIPSRGLIGATADTMRDYGFTPGQIRDIGAAALEVYCPDQRP
jgi:hypothetical protein